MTDEMPLTDEELLDVYYAPVLPSTEDTEEDMEKVLMIRGHRHRLVAEVRRLREENERLRPRDYVGGAFGGSTGGGRGQAPES